jgi:hypothetical protein
VVCTKKRGFAHFLIKRFVQILHTFQKKVCKKGLKRAKNRGTSPHLTTTTPLCKILITILLLFIGGVVVRYIRFLDSIKKKVCMQGLHTFSAVYRKNF